MPIYTPLRFRISPSPRNPKKKISFLRRRRTCPARAGQRPLHPAVRLSQRRAATWAAPTSPPPGPPGPRGAPAAQVRRTATRLLFPAPGDALRRRPPPPPAVPLAAREHRRRAARLHAGAAPSDALRRLRRLLAAPSSPAEAPAAAPLPGEPRASPVDLGVRAPTSPIQI